MQHLFGLCVSLMIVTTVACQKKKEEEPTKVFTSGQAASFVLGQSTFSGTSSALTATGMNVPGAVTVSPSGVVYVAEQNNNRVLGFAAEPTSNGETATTVLGDNSFTWAGSGTTADEMNSPAGVSTYGAQVFVADTGNNRVLIFNTVTTGASAALAIGQSSTSGGTAGAVSATGLDYPTDVSAGGGKIAIADTSHNRVVLYNSIPSSNLAAAAVALGQVDLNNGASGSNTKMNSPRSVWTDGTKILVADTNNNRVLVWNSWPSTSGTAPDLILGQPSLASNTANNGGASASSLDHPEGVASDGTEVFVSDLNNHRVLNWKTWPTSNKQAADLVIGQPDFTTVSSGASAAKFNNPRRMYYSGGSLYVSDSSNNRVLLFKKQ